MKKATGRILKSNDIKLEGRFHLDTEQPLSGTQLKILEDNSEYTLICITCSCGKQISVRCEYADNISSEHSVTT